MSAKPLPAGTFVRREHDGMLGQVGRAWAIVRSGYNQPIQDVVWLGEWTKGNLYEEIRRRRKIAVLTGAEAAVAAAAFAALTCPVCAGTGRPNAKVSGTPYGSERCPAPDCLLGRRRGVNAQFDASYALYRQEIDAYDAVDRAAQRGDAPARLEQSERELSLRFAAHCTSCGATLSIGETALARRTPEGRWGFRCLRHAQGS